MQKTEKKKTILLNFGEYNVNRAPLNRRKLRW